MIKSPLEFSVCMIQTISLAVNEPISIGVPVHRTWVNQTAGPQISPRYAVNENQYISTCNGTSFSSFIKFRYCTRSHDKTFFFFHL